MIGIVVWVIVRWYKRRAIELAAKKLAASQLRKIARKKWSDGTTVYAPQTKSSNTHLK